MPDPIPAALDIPQMTDHVLLDEIGKLRLWLDENGRDHAEFAPRSAALTELSAEREQRLKRNFQEALGPNSNGGDQLGSQYPWVTPNGQTYIDPTPPGAFPTEPIPVFPDQDGNLFDAHGNLVGHLPRHAPFAPIDLPAADELRKLVGTLDDPEQLRAKRRRALERVAEGEGVIYVPRGDLAKDEVFESEQRRLGFRRTDDQDLTGWEPIPIRRRRIGGPDWIDELDPLTKLGYAITRMIETGKFTEEEKKQIKELLNPVNLAIMIGLALLLAELGEILAVIFVGKDFFQLCDAMSEITKSENTAQFDRGVDLLAKAVAALGIDAVLLFLAGRAKAAKKGPMKPAATSWPEGLEPLDADGLQRGSGGQGPRSPEPLPYGEYYGEPPRNPRGPEPGERLPYDLEPSERTPGAERARSRGYSLDPHGHHPLPQYLGGEFEQGLEGLRPDIHEQYHRELDVIAPRRWGTAYFEWLRNNDYQAFLRLIRELIEMTRSFDERFGTNLLPGLLDGLQQSGIWP